MLKADFLKNIQQPGNFWKQNYIYTEALNMIKKYALSGAVI
jgi:hypothetical protein